MNPPTPTIQNPGENREPGTNGLVRNPGNYVNNTTFHIPSLDGIRAFSFLIVFVSHAGLNKYIPGHFGLSMFFFLSGYLITTYLRIEFERTGTVSLKHFYLRRAFRILPLFYLILSVVTLLAYADVIGGGPRADAVLLQFLHLANYQVIRDGWWGGAAAGTWVYWSLAIEEHFYLGFPLLYLWLRNRGTNGRQLASILITICVLILIWRCILIFSFDVPRDRVYLGTDTRIDSILAGCILAIWGNPVLDQSGPSDKKLAFIWLPVGIAAILLSLLPRTHEYDQTIRYTLQSFGLTPFFIAAIRWHNRGVFRILNLAPVRYLGMLSYSLYLMHTSMLFGLDRWLPTWPVWLRGALALAVLIIIAKLLYHLVERPCARMRSSLALSLEAPVSTVKT